MGRAKDGTPLTKSSVNLISDSPKTPTNPHTQPLNKPIAAIDDKKEEIR